MKLRPFVFWPPFLLLMGAVILSFLSQEEFLQITKSANQWVLDSFGWLFNAGTLFILGTCIWIYFSPLGKVKIGGNDAVPFLTKWRWFSITLCTTVAVGILFWSTAEPLYHLYSPPESLGIAPNSAAAAKFAMSTMFLHWTFTPYAIYTIPTLMFALAYYNMGQSFSLGAPLSPLFGKKIKPMFSQGIDAICLYTLVAGMASSLATGVLILNGGMNHFFHTETTKWTLAIVTMLIVGAFVISAVSGLMKGIRVLSDINLKVFIVLVVFVFLTGPTSFILSFGAESFGIYLSNFLDKSLFTGSASKDSWPQAWTIFYWANWLAWAPVTALFLGRIAYGYTVRQVIWFNLILPALFACFWMATFSGTAIYMEFFQTEGLMTVLKENGPENVVYKIFSKLPLPTITIAVFLFSSFLSYVTAADSNTNAMGGISSSGISPKARYRHPNRLQHARN